MSLTIDKAQVTLGNQSWSFDMALDTHGVYALLGRSGAGKSTLLNAIGGYIEPDSGQVAWKNHPLNGLAPAHRPITTLFQSDNLFAHLSVADNIGLGIDPRMSLDKQQIEAIGAALSDVGLGGFGARKPHSLSGGERQRVALARCLLRARPVLLMDEPFGALDGNTRANMLSLTRDLIARNRPCVLMITHDPADATTIEAESLYLGNGGLIHKHVQPTM